jgi:hypothetical protein
MTKTHVIDGVTYVEVDRKAKVGEKIIIVNEDMADDNYENGDILTVRERYSLMYDGVYVEGIDGMGIRDYEYRTLEPLESEEATVDATQASPEVIDLLANLARRVTSLESQLREAQRNIETWAEETKNNEYAIVSVNKLAEQNEHELANTRHRLAKHADRFAAVEDKVEMLTDDIVELDSRTQPLTETDAAFRTKLRLQALRGF